MINKKQYAQGFWITILSIICFSMVEVIGVLIFQRGGTPLTLLTGRAIIAVVVFALLIPICGKKLKIEKKDILLFLVAGLFMAFMLISFYNGLQALKNIAVHLSIFFLHPIFMAFCFLFWE